MINVLSMPFHWKTMQRRVGSHKRNVFGIGSGLHAPAVEWQRNGRSGSVRRRRYGQQLISGRTGVRFHHVQVRRAEIFPRVWPSIIARSTIIDLLVVIHSQSMEM